MAQIMNSGLLAGNEEGLHDLIRLPDITTKQRLVRTLYRSIEKAYKNFQVEIQNVLVNEKRENWRAVNLSDFNYIEESLQRSELWASYSSR